MTFTVVVAVTAPLVVFTVAVIVEFPDATPVTSPEEFTVAFAVEEDVQVTLLVRSFVELSAKVPVAVSCTVPLVATLGFAGVMAREVSATVDTVTVEFPVSPPEVAEIVELPAATAVTSPALLTVATPVDELCHVAELVTSELLPPTVTAVAENCFVSPTFMKRFVGATVTELVELSETKKSEHPAVKSTRAIAGSSASSRRRSITCLGADSTPLKRNPTLYRSCF